MSAAAVVEAERVEVVLGQRSYDILIGPGVLAETSRRIAALGARSVGIVTDSNVAPLYLAQIESSLDVAGVAHASVVVPAGEASKCFAQLERVVDALIAAKIERGDVVLALGGGVVGDLAGFAAAIVRRGVRVVQAPTSLLAQVDSSVGGKTGINSPRGKNLIGSFHQPSLVLADTASLDTLPERELKAGYAEVAKYGLIDDEPFFAWLEANPRAAFVEGPDRIRAIATSCRAKAAVVARDELETGDRALLNLGHTFGHALEADVAYDGARLIHGEGVAIGMAMAFRFSARLGLAPAADAERVERHLKAVGLPTRVSEIPGAVGDAETLFGHMLQDKKVSRGRLTFILARGVGKSFVARDVSGEDALTFLRAELGETS